MSHVTLYRLLAGAMFTLGGLAMDGCSVDTSAAPPTHDECLKSSDCSGGKLCRDGACVDTCVSNTDCASGLLCDVTIGHCVPALGNGGAPGTSGAPGSTAGTSGASVVGSGGSLGSGGSAGAGGSVTAGGSAGSGNASGAGNVTPGSCTVNLPATPNGSATFYTLAMGSVEVNCGFAIVDRGADIVAHVSTGAGKYFAAMNTADYANAAVCGACIEVTRDDTRKVVATVVDQCPVATNPKCTKGHIDLSQEAFQQIGTTDEGYLGTSNGGAVGKISWRYVACPTTEKVTFRLKEPTNANWNQILVQGHAFPIKSLELMLNGQWTSMARQVYNYFQAGSGAMGSAPYQVRVTDVNGATLTQSLNLQSGDLGGTQQFPACN